jgi:hypothetical protein
MINIFQGALGSGKSASMVMDLIDHLLNGGVCAANFQLVPGWAEKLVKGSLRYKIGLLPHWPKIARELQSRFRVVQDLEEIEKATEELIPLATGKAAKEYEGHGRLYLDEAQLIFNSRQWTDNQKWIHFFSQSRKKKWDVVLVAHSIQMIDKQIRPFLEFETRFRDMRRIKFLGMIPMAPKRVPIFIAITRYAGLGAGAGEIYRRRLYPLVKAYSSLYDSALVFGQAGAAGNAHGIQKDIEGLSPLPECSQGGGEAPKAPFSPWPFPGMVHCPESRRVLYRDYFS